MSTLSTIRALIADRAVYVKEQDDFAGSSFQVIYMPLVALGSNGVIITLQNGMALDVTAFPFTLDLESGVVTFTGTAPSAQMLTVEYSHVSLTDDTIQTLIDLNVDGQDPVRLAAADCLDAIASSQAIIEKKITLLDMETDGAAVAKALRDHATALRKLVFSPDFQDSTFDFIEQINLDDQPAWWEKVKKDWLRVMP